MITNSLILVFTLLFGTVLCVDHDTFKNCSQSFCGDLRNVEIPVESYYGAEFFADIENGFLLNLTNNNGDRNLTLQVNEVYTSNWYPMFRFQIDDPENPRFKLDQVLREEILNSEPASGKKYRIEKSKDGLKIYSDEFFGYNLVVIYGPPFYIEVSMLTFDGDITIKEITQISINGSNFIWQEDTGHFAFDVTFPNSQVLYGLFHHADTMALRHTADGSVDPYRLRNSDTFEYEVNSTMALYGSIPVIYGHSTNGNNGIFLHNAAEQWVDISHGERLSARFIVDAGALDLFLFIGPNPQSIVHQYEYLTGVAHLPQLWTLGYHQCRWTYWTQEDILDVVENMDEYDFPIDAMWLDDGYSDGNRYLVWNPENFTDPLGLQDKIGATNRKLVVISDPHIKVDDDYFVYSQAKELDLFVKNPNGTNYEGECWPGLSSYLDFLNDDTIEFYANLYSYENFANSTPVIAGIWNDMNEPSVFDDSLEKTLPFDLVHHGGIEHRDVHNIYGLQQTKATHLGLLRRDNGTTRPFILSRSTFAGSQRYAAMWTGDNTATWDHLAVTFSECLTANILGQVWCGADVGAFHEVPDDVLALRWFQSAAWLPFYRGHSEARLDPEPPRREPYTYPENIRNLIREALKTRYSHIPQWYRLFYEHTRNRDPVIRPLFYQYPEDDQVFTIDNQLLLGSDILVQIITEPNIFFTSVYLPGIHQYWYQANGDAIYPWGLWYNIPVDETFIPVYYRGGSIIVRKDTPRPTTKDMEDDPYDLYAYLDQEQNANGTIYFDDFTSFRYRDNNEYGYYFIEYNGTSEELTFTAIDDFAVPPGSAYIGSLTVYRFPEKSTGPVTKKMVTHTAQGYLLNNIDIAKEKKLVIQL